MIMSLRLSMKRERNHPEERISHKPGKDDKENGAKDDGDADSWDCFGE